MLPRQQRYDVSIDASNTANFDPQESLANRVCNLERRSAALRESLPVPMPEHMADEMARWRAGLKPFREQASYCGD